VEKVTVAEASPINRNAASRASRQPMPIEPNATVAARRQEPSMDDAAMNDAAMDDAAMDDATMLRPERNGNLAELLKDEGAAPGFQQVTNFQFDLSKPDVIEDEDQTDAGRNRLREIEARAMGLYAEHESLQQQRLPLAIPRDILLNEYVQAQNRLVAANQQGALATQ
jgi:hypothetical protein